MNNELGWGETFFTVVLSTSILYVISIGLYLNFIGFTFFGYITFIIGGLFVYFLCYNYFERKKVNKKPLTKFKLEFMSKKEVERNIGNCEGKHIQQVIYSTYHKALTQICFSCKKIRTSLKRKELTK